VEALRSIGARVEHLGNDGYPPLRVHPADAGIKDTVEFGRTASSQFISALLLIAPNLARGLRIRCRGELTSPDYVYMTTSMLHAWGAAGAPGQASCSAAEEGLVLDWRIGPGMLKGREYTIEPDASGATYFEAAAALVPGARVTLPGLPASPGSMQGDIKFANVLEEAGAAYSGDPERDMVFRGGTIIRPFDWDFSTIPDTAMTGAVIACFASPTADNPSATSTLRGLRTLRVKETDRLEALRTELSKIGATVEIFKDGDDEGLRITPPRTGKSGAPAEAPPVCFDTYNDHRMAMALALVGLRRPNVSIRNPACVAKTYPSFWRDLARLYG
jgi:3-phosphoshikimate 1-carboxyvinyltransferase